MNRGHLPCRCCAKFLPTGGQKPHEDGQGYCGGHERDAYSTDSPCVLFTEQGSRAAREGARSSQERLAELQRRQSPAPPQRGMLASQAPRKHETISRASAPQQSKLERATT